jgi:hypothetical protein
MSEKKLKSLNKVQNLLIICLSLEGKKQSLLTLRLLLFARNGTCYFITPNSLPTLVKAAMALSKCSLSCAADI